MEPSIFFALNLLFMVVFLAFFIYIFRAKNKFNFLLIFILSIVSGLITHAINAFIQVVTNDSPQSFLFYLGAEGWAIFIVPAWLMINLAVAWMIEAIFFFVGRGKIKKIIQP